MKKLDEEMGTKAKDFSKIKKKQKTKKNLHTTFCCYISAVYVDLSGA